MKVKEFTLDKNGFNQKISYSDLKFFETLIMDFQIITEKLPSRKDMEKKFHKLFDLVSINNDLFFASDSIKVVELPSTLEDKSFSNKKECKIKVSLCLHLRDIPNKEDKTSCLAYQEALKYMSIIREGIQSL